MKKSIAIIVAALIAVLSVSVCMPAFADYAADLAEGSEKTVLFVEFEEDAVLQSACTEEEALELIEDGREEPLEKLERIVDDFDVDYSYTNVVNGIAFEAEKKEIKKIEKIDGVLNVVELGYVGVTASEPVPEKTDISSGTMIGLDKVRELGYDGAGTAVAVIDGGFDLDHEAMVLSDPSTAKYSKEDIRKILKNADFNCQASADDVYRSSKVPFAYDYCEENLDMDDGFDSEPDHGTHVAGIAVGNSSSIVGIAPEAQILMFKVDVYDEEIFMANLLAAVDDAAKFDITSINMSLGLDYAMPDDPQYELLAKAFVNARNKGITMCTAAGNSWMYSDSVLTPDNGTNGVPNSFDGAFSVASVDNINLSPKVESPAAIVYGDDKKAEITGYALLNSLKPGEFAVVTSKNYKNIDLNGKYALIAEYIGYDAKNSDKLAEKLRDSGCIAVISSGSNYWLEDYIWSKYFSLVYIDELDAYRIAKCGNNRISFEKTGYYVEPAEDIHPSYYTSYGVSEDLKMTVDIAAPGGVIYSGVAGGYYDVYDGTSMASPHITGSAALIDQYMAERFPDVKDAARSDLKESLMMSTADPVEYGQTFASPRAVGAGLVNLDQAVKTNAILTDGNGTSALNIGDGIEDSITLTFTVKNISDTEVTYDTVDFRVITDAYTTTRAFDSNTGMYNYTNTLTGYSVDIPYTVLNAIPETITVPAGSEKEISAEIALDAEWLESNAEVFENGFYIEGYILVYDSEGSEIPINMPFMGFRGDWSQIPALNYGDVYENWLGMMFYVGEGYQVDRNLKSLTIEYIDKDGETAAEATFEYVIKGSYYSEDDFINEVYAQNENLALNGEYTFRVTAVPYEGSEPQVCVEKEVTFRPYHVYLISAKSVKNSDGTYDISVTSSDENVLYFELEGANLSNGDFRDIYPVDKCDYRDEDGNCVYVLKGCEYPHTSLQIWGINDDGIGSPDARIGKISPLVEFFNRIKRFFENIAYFFKYGFRMW